MNAPTMTSNIDISDEQEEIARLRSELRVAQANEAQARQALAEHRATFISMLTHDLKNPLTTIMGRVEMLKRVSKRPQITGTDIDRHLTPLNDAVNRLQELLQTASQRDVSPETH